MSRSAVTVNLSFPTIEREVLVETEAKNTVARPQLCGVEGAEGRCRFVQLT